MLHHAIFLLDFSEVARASLSLCVFLKLTAPPSLILADNTVFDGQIIFMRRDRRWRAEIRDADL